MIGGDTSFLFRLTKNGTTSFSDLAGDHRLNRAILSGFSRVHLRDLFSVLTTFRCPERRKAYLFSNLGQSALGYADSAFVHHKLVLKR